MAQWGKMSTTPELWGREDHRGLLAAVLAPASVRDCCKGIRPKVIK